MSQQMSAKEFMEKGTKTSYPGVVFQQTGALFVGTVIGNPEVVFTKDEEDDAEPTPKLVVNMRCDQVGGNITTKVKVNGMEQEVLPTVGEMYSFWMKGRTSMLRSVNEAVINAGVADGVPEDQGRIGLQMVGTGERKKASWNPPKLFTAQYVAAPKNIETANLLGMQTNLAQAPAPQPQYAPQAPQQPMMAPQPQYAPQPMQPMAPPPAPQPQPGFGNLLG